MPAVYLLPIVKKCPFCAEDIQDEAVKCRYCGEFFSRNKPEAVKWYYKTYWLVIAFLCIGPFALPLLWLNPRFSIRAKIIVTIITILVSYYLTVSMIKAINLIIDYYGQLYL